MIAENEITTYELTCRRTCPFGHACERSYSLGEIPCTTNANIIVSKLGESLSKNPTLDPDRLGRKFTEPEIGRMRGDGLKITVVLDSSESIKAGGGTPSGPFRIELGEIKNGYVIFNGFEEDVMNRVGRDIPVIVTPQS